jgi:hypothetical protein
MRDLIAPDRHLELQHITSERSREDHRFRLAGMLSGLVLAEIAAAEREEATRQTRIEEIRAILGDVVPRPVRPQ